MPSINKTPNLGLNQWGGNENPKRQDFVDDNATIDAAVKANTDAINGHIGNSTHITSAERTAWNSKQDAITGGASTIDTENLTASRALISDANGKVAVSAVTSTELGYLDGVTAAIQTQLNGKAASSHNHAIANITDLRINNGELEYYDGGWQSVGIQPTKPRTADLQFAARNLSTYYTIANVIGKGKLNRIRLQANGVAGFSLKITIDGVVNTISGSSLNAQTRQENENSYLIGIELDVYFKTSALVEVSNSSTTNFGCALDYALV
ncbi:MAG: PaBG [Anaerosolibacter sp.]|jgi:hypothetical protein|uniref:hypothetical protein n=1 Tax=Anaerosolibacter sp. TaxID=1872527 RepID=UPI0026352857|nr:hypothetical protein [Anaerosolibacter sp.]MDF2546155.1 PaBG [Anaerosolibacter sp.]